MLRCLILCRNLLRSVAMSSSRLTIRRWKKLAAMARYGNTRELSTVTLSSTIPSSSNSISLSSVAPWLVVVGGTCCSVGMLSPGDTALLGAALLVADTVPIGDALLTRVAAALMGAGVNAGSSADVEAGELAARLRLPLSRFFFLLAASVCEYFLLRALACCRRWSVRHPQGQRKSCRRLFRG